MALRIAMAHLSFADGDAHGTDVVRVKAAGLEVVTMGESNPRAPSPGHRTIRLDDASSGRYLEVTVTGGRVVGATCVGAGQVGADLVAAYTRRTPVPADPAYLLLRPIGPGATVAGDPTAMPDRTTVCRCNGVTKRDIVASWRDGATSVADVAARTRATTGCGGCKETVAGLVDWLAESDPAQFSRRGRGLGENSVTPSKHAVTAGKSLVHPAETLPG